METDIQLGAYTVPVILTVILAIVYKFAGTGLPDKWKAVIACLVGIALGFVALWYAGKPWLAVNIVDNGIYGLMTGASAVGLYELSRTVINPRL